MKRSDIVFGLLRIPIDFAMVALAFLSAYNLRLKGDFIPGRFYEFSPDEFPPLSQYLQLSLTFALMLVIVFMFFGHYRLTQKDHPIKEIKRILSGSFVWLLLMMSYFFVVREIFFSRLVLIFAAVFTVLFILLARFIQNQIRKQLLKANIGRRKVLLIGGNKITKTLAKALQKDLHYNIAGYLTSKNTKIEGLKKLGSIKDLKKVVKRYQIEELIQTNQNLTELQDHDILDFSQEHHLDYRFVPDILEVERSNVEIEPIAGLPLIHLKPTSLDGWGKVYKRIIDLTLGSIAFTLLIPLFIVVAIGIKLDSPGPILFTKLDNGKTAKRIGRHGKAFKFYKFRTMRHKSHNERYGKLSKKNIRKGGPLVKIKDDPRITGFGRLLRRFDIDELPQLINVLKGEMSLVGPRPHLPEEVALYEKHHKFLLTIKPGMTGLATVSGRSDLEFEEEARLGSYYIKHWTPFWDFKLMFKTIMVILKRHSAE